MYTICAVKREVVCVHFCEKGNGEYERRPRKTAVYILDALADWTGDWGDEDLVHGAYPAGISWYRPGRKGERPKERVQVLDQPPL